MKWYTYLICFILIIVGVFCGIELYKEVKAESYVNGSIDISNKFSQESFNYSSSRWSQLRKALAVIVLETGIIDFAPQFSHLTTIPSSVTST